jgi:hypothetical protein
LQVAEHLADRGGSASNAEYLQRLITSITAVSGSAIRGIQRQMTNTEASHFSGVSLNAPPMSHRPAKLKAARSALDRRRENLDPAAIGALDLDRQGLFICRDLRLSSAPAANLALLCPLRRM